MSEFTIETHDGVAELGADEWSALVENSSPFLEYGFLTALEDAGCVGDGTGWFPAIVSVRRAGELVAACPFYIKTHSKGEFVFDWSWADAAHRAGIQYYPKGVVAVPFTPVTGERLLVRGDLDGSEREMLRRVLIEATLEVAEQAGLSSVHYNFVISEELKSLEELEIPGRSGVQYHWKNPAGDGRYESFDDYLARFRSKQRANIRRERRKLGEDGVVTRVVRGDELTHELMDRMFEYYRSTVRKFHWGHQYLNREFFHLALERIRDRIHIVVAERDSEEYAGAFNLFKDGRLYGRYWGCSKEVQFTHFEVCFYKAIEWCIEHEVDVFEPGAGGEHKFQRGFEATKTYSAHFMRDPRLDRAIADFLDYEKRHVDRHVDLLNEEGPFKD